MNTTTREHFRQTLATLADKARAALPQQVNGRLESAVKLVLLDEIHVQDDGSITVGSCADPRKTYTLEGTRCTCQDYDHAPDHWCKHRIAAGLHKRVRALLAAENPAPSPPVETGSLPEAPSSVNFRCQVGGFEMQFTLRDQDEHRLLERLQTLLKDQRIRPVPKPAPRPQGQWKGRNKYQGA